MISSRRSRAAALCAALLIATGCAGTSSLLPEGSAPIELTNVPFFPQTEYECGPAALATVLAHAGAAVDADGLVREVYVEGLRGSLQAELLGATRRHGFIPYVLSPEPSALLAELGAGRPVLVLQNLGFEKVPVWHYAVVVGTDGDDVILRSGTEQRRLERRARFLRSWQRGSYWAFVVLEPGSMPATAAAPSYARAVAGAEPLLPSAATAAAYAAGLRRWPDDELVLFGAAGFALGAHDSARAIELYRRLLAAAPGNAAARNNLANALAERGCLGEALREAQAALASVDAADALYDPIRDTVAELEAAAAKGASSVACL